LYSTGYGHWVFGDRFGGVFFGVWKMLRFGGRLEWRI
jgi:hypothetical protein